MAAKQAILRALGVAADSAEESGAVARRAGAARVGAAAAARRGRRTRGPVELPLNVAAESLGEPARISRSAAKTAKSANSSSNLWDLPQVGSVGMDGSTWVQKQATLPHRACRSDITRSRVEGRRGRGRARATSSRPTARGPTRNLGRGGRAAGIAVSLYGVRSERNWGCGDFRDLRRSDRLGRRDLGASFVALNPLHAIHNRRPFNTSPYLPNCIFYQNFLYLDVEGMEDFAALPARARAARIDPRSRGEIEALRATPFVEYERVSALKLRFLKLAFAQFLREWRAGSARAREFDAFREREGDLLEKFATYCALDEHLHRAESRPLDLDRLAGGIPGSRARPKPGRSAKNIGAASCFISTCSGRSICNCARAQQRARDRHLSIGLYHDLALATDRFGSDLWAHRPFYVAGCRVGSPPDDFSPKGQDWAFPPPNSARHREDGYRLFAESIRKNCRHGGALRIDHVMRLFRLFWIPDGIATPRTAPTCANAIEDFVRILALESVRNQVIVVGEDLGTVEPSIRETLARFGILSYRLFYFEKNERGEFRRNEEYPRQALVSSTTHDLPTLAGFWVGADIEARRAAGIIDDETRRAQFEHRERRKAEDARPALRS